MKHTVESESKKDFRKYRITTVGLSAQSLVRVRFRSIEFVRNNRNVKLKGGVFLTFSELQMFSICKKTCTQTQTHTWLKLRCF